MNGLTANLGEITTLLCLILYSVFCGTQPESDELLTFTNEIRCPQDCYCRREVVNCTDKGYQKLPKLPIHTTKIIFKHNPLGNVTRKTFENVDHLGIIYLDLSYCYVKHVAPDAFQRLPYLTALNVSGWAKLKDPSNVFRALFHTPVRDLTFNYAKLSDNIFRNICQPLILENVTTRNISGNRFHYTDSISWLNCCLPNLKTMSIIGNRIRTFSVQQMPTNLKFLNITSNEVIDLDISCSESNMFGLEYLDLSNNFLSNIDGFHTNGTCLPNLTELYLDHLPLRIIRNYAFSELSSLQHLSLDFIGRLHKIEENAFSSESLESLKIGSMNDFQLDDSSYLFLHECPNLKTFIMIRLQMPEDNGYSIRNFLSPLTKLRELTLKFASIGELPKNSLVNSTALTSLSLIGNYFSKWDPGIFVKLSMLQYIDFSSNHITDLKETSFPQSIWKNLNVLDLSHNPFVCSCQLYWFRHIWINENQYKLRGFPEDYYCESPHSMEDSRLVKYNPSKAECLDPLVVMAIIVTISVLICSLTGFLLFKYRWHIKYYIYRLRMRRQYKRIPEGDSYQFDAFVAYNSVDRSWVLTELMPFLEKQQKFRLCLHDRDFEAGRLIMDNIVDNMRKSRKVILVLSNSFANNQWCQFEALMAQSRFLREGRTPLILVMLENLTSRHLTGPLGVLLQNNAIIEWTTDAVGKELFWHKLLTSLNQSFLE